MHRYFAAAHLFCVLRTINKIYSSVNARYLILRIVRDYYVHLKI